MPTPTKHKTAQAHTLKYPEAIGEKLTMATNPKFDPRKMIEKRVHCWGQC